MRVCLAAVGRLRPGPMRALLDEYAGRSTWPLTIREVEARKKLSGPALREHEGELLLAAIPDKATLIALDERGRDLGSKDFAERLGRWRDDGIQDLAFAIGGADGLSQAVRDRASLSLAFGRATWPHMLVRVMLAEQIYRAQTILSGHPYHRE